MKLCKRCSENFDDGMRFCPKCGAELINDPDTTFKIENGVLVDINLSRYSRSSIDRYKFEIDFNMSDDTRLFVWHADRYMYFGDWKKKSIISIPNGVTKIKDNMCIHDIISYEFIIPSSVKEIGGSLFYDSRFYKITIPGSVKTIKGMFTKSNVNILTFENGVNIIEKLMWSSNIKKLTLPNTLKELGINWSLASTIGEMTVPRSVTFWAYGSYHRGDSNSMDVNSNYKPLKVDNLRYEGTKSQLKRLFEESLRRPRDRYENEVYVDESQIIHCSDGDVRCINKGTTFDVVNA